MTTTPNLALTHIESSQGQKEVTANEFADGLDNGIAGYVEIPVDVSSDVTLDNVTQATFAILKFTGVLTDNINILIPTLAANKKFIVHNGTTGDYILTIKHESSTGVILKQNERRWVYSDGTEIYFLISHPRIKTVAFADPLILDWSDADTIFVQLAGDTTAQHTNAVAGQRLNLVVQQDTTGARLITWSAEVRFGTDISSITLTNDPDKQDKIGFVYNDDGALFYDVVSLVKGF